MQKPKKSRSMTAVFKSQMEVQLSKHHPLQPSLLSPAEWKVEAKGSMEEGEAEPVIIGGMVLDIQATSSIPPHPRTTCPGKVHYVLGGVARNVAECMWKLGAKPFMISAVGFDMAAIASFRDLPIAEKNIRLRGTYALMSTILNHWKVVVGALGISKAINRSFDAGIRKHQDIKTATVCHILDVSGEVAAGVASLDSVERYLTPQWIQQFRRNIPSAPVLMVDANLSLPALEAACQMAVDSNVPVWFEPVSIAKSKRIATIAKHVAFTSPNEDELIVMANALSSEDVFHPIEKKMYSRDALLQLLKPAILVLLEKGIKIVVLTLGSDGVFLCFKGESNILRFGQGKIESSGFSRKLFETMTSLSPPNWYSGGMILDRSSNFLVVHFPALPASVVRLTGAGDCLVGGTLASICVGLDLMQSIAVGIAAAKAAVEAESNVPPQFNLDSITGDARTVYYSARVLSSLSKL